MKEETKRFLTNGAAIAAMVLPLYPLTLSLGGKVNDLELRVVKDDYRNRTIERQITRELQGMEWRLTELTDRRLSEAFKDLDRRMDKIEIRYTRDIPSNEFLGADVGRKPSTPTGTIGIRGKLSLD